MRFGISVSVLQRFGGIFDEPLKRERLEEVLRELENPDIWNDPKAAQEFAKEKGRLEAVLGSIDAVDAGLEDVAVSLEFAAEEDDESFASEAEALLWAGRVPPTQVFRTIDFVD